MIAFAVILLRFASRNPLLYFLPSVDTEFADVGKLRLEDLNDSTLAFRTPRPSSFLPFSAWLFERHFSRFSNFQLQIDSG